MQAGRLITRSLEAEAEGTTLDLESEGHAPAVLAFSKRLDRAIARRENRAMLRLAADLAPRDAKVRFAG